MNHYNRILVTISFLIGLSYYTVAQMSGSKQILWTTDWSPNGKLIAVGGNIDALKIYKEKNPTSYRSFPIKNTITRIKWHPSKNMIAVGTQQSADKSCIIDLDSNKKTVLNGISNEGARGVDWNYSGDFLAVADNDGQIAIFDVHGQLVRTCQHENTKGITAIAWHPQKNIFITVGDKIRIFDINGTLLNTIKHRQEDVLLLSVVWHKSGDLFVTGDYGHDDTKTLLQYWNEKGILIRSIDLSKGEFRNMTWNKKGDKLATASDALRIWDKDGNLIAEGQSEDYLWGVSWHKKGKKIITSSLEQRIILWNDKAERIITLE